MVGVLGMAGTKVAVPEAAGTNGMKLEKLMYNFKI